MKKLWLILGALLICIPVASWWFSPTQVVKRRTKHLMEVLSLSDGAGGPTRQLKVYSMNALLSDHVELEIPDTSEANGIFDKLEMESAFSWICQNAKKSSFQVDDFVRVEISGETAEVEAEISGSMELPSYRPADGEYLMEIRWQKSGDGWRFDKVVWKER
ncbi:MAG: hypothetical protein ACSHX7_06200 [Luteolibacter sp.]